MLTRLAVDLVPVSKDRDVVPGMALAWRDESDAAVLVVVVVPSDEALCQDKPGEVSATTMCLDRRTQSCSFDAVDDVLKRIETSATS